MVPVCIMQFSSLVIIRISYLSIRTRLEFRAVPAAKRQNRQNNEKQDMKFSCEFSVPLLYCGTLFNVGNSIVDAIIYSSRMPIFKEMLKRLKPRRASRKYSEC